VIVLSGGSASAEQIGSGAVASVALGGSASALSLAVGGTLIDNGGVEFGSQTLAGSLSGAGAIVESGGTLLLSGAGTAFKGEAVISGGVVEIATSMGIGTAAVVFAASAGSATLQVDAVDTPAAGGSLANALSNFAGSAARLDLAGLIYVSGATAAVSGSTLILTDAGAKYHFRLAGSVAGAYAVASDGNGGTLITPETPSAVAVRRAVIAQSMATFGDVHAVSVGSGLSGGTSSAMAEILKPR